MSIRIKDGTVEVVRGTSKAGKAYELRKQSAFLHAGEEVRALKIVLGRDQAPYAVGVYEIDQRCFDVNGYGDLFINRLRLIAVKA